MNVINFVTDNWDSITTVGALIGGWIWRRAHNQKTESLSDMLLKLGRQALPAVIKEARLYDDAYVNGQIRKAILSGLDRLKLPMNTATMRLVDIAVESVHDELASQLFSAHLDGFVKVQTDTLRNLATALPPSATP